MTADARRLLTEEERARIRPARERGGTCAGCGRALAEGEPVWWARFTVGADRRGRPSYWRAPVGRECAAPAFLTATEARTPAPCVACGRPVYYAGPDYGHRVAACSRACARRYRSARTRKGEPA